MMSIDNIPNPNPTAPPASILFINKPTPKPVNKNPKKAMPLFTLFMMKTPNVPYHKQYIREMGVWLIFYKVY